jgi:hypothetical protein
VPNDRAVAIRQDLTAVVLGDKLCARAAARRLTAWGAWPTAVALSAQWRITPFLYRKVEGLSSAGGDAPIDAASRLRLRELTVVATAQMTLLIERSRTALALIETAGYEAVAIKGIALIAGLYDRRATRMINDLDIIVRERDFGAVKRVLETAGFADRSPEFARHIADVASSERLHNYARTFVHDGFEVDAHWRIGRNPPAALAAERIIDRAQRVMLGRAQIHVASPVEAMLIGTHHSLRGYFVPRETLKDACDLGAWWTLGRSRWNLDELLETAREAELATSLSALWDILCRRYPGHPAQEGVAALERRMSAQQRGEARRLGQFFEDQLAFGNHAERTVQFFATSVARRSIAAKSQAWLTVGLAAHPGPDIVARRPLTVRIAGLAARVFQVMRELGRVRSLPTYRAVARAQSRYH